MPYPTHITPTLLAATARDLIEAHGVEALAFKPLADALGVTPPALYKHVADKRALLTLVRVLCFQELGTAIHAAIAAAPPDNTAQLLAFAHAYRSYAQRYPAASALMFTPQAQASGSTPMNATGTDLTRLLMGVLTPTYGDTRAADVLVGLWALIHGFTLLENSGRLHGDDAVRAAVFEGAVHALLAGWQPHSP